MELELALASMGLSLAAAISGTYTGMRMTKDFEEGRDTFFSRANYYIFIKKEKGKTLQEILRENQIEFYRQGLNEKLRVN